MPLFIEYENVIKEDLKKQKVKELLESIKKEISINPPDEKRINEIDQVSGAESKEKYDALIMIDLGIADDGSLRMYMKDAKQPLRFYPESETLWVTAYYKRLLAMIGMSFTRVGLIGKIAILITLKNNLQGFSDWFDYIFSFKKVLLNEQNYSQPTKELRRVLKDKLPIGIINALTMIIEIDTAYRWRFQDIISELKQENLEGFGVFKEIGRLLNILRQREKMGYISGKLNGIKWLVYALLLLSPKTRKLIRDILKELNLNELRFSVEDDYWINQNRADYKFKGLSLEERHKLNIEKYGSVY